MKVVGTIDEPTGCLDNQNAIELNLKIKELESIKLKFQKVCLRVPSQTFG